MISLSSRLCCAITTDSNLKIVKRNKTTNTHAHNNNLCDLTRYIALKSGIKKIIKENFAKEREMINILYLIIIDLMMPMG